MGSTGGYDLKKILVSTTGLAVLFMIIILINIIISYADIRWDATEDKIYSLSQGTKNIVSNIEVPITVKFFFSRSNPDVPVNMKIYAKRVLEFLYEYKRASRGKIKVEDYDPRADSDEEEWAQKYGIKAIQLPSGNKIYLGAVFLAADQEETIEFLDPNREELLEYDITRIIHRLMNPEQKVIGIISPLPVFGSSDMSPVKGQYPEMSPWFFVTELKKTYDVRKIDFSADSIDPDVDLLVIIHPKEMKPEMQYAVDQYVLSGGNAIVFVDPFCIMDSQGNQQFMSPQGSSLNKLFAAWGISMDTGKVVADLDYPTYIRTRNNMTEESPVMLTVRGQALNRSDVVTSKLETMLFPVVGAITKTEESNYQFETMVRSGKNSELISSFKAGLGAAAIRRDFAPTPEDYNLVVLVRGKFKTAFTAGPPKEKGSKTGASGISRKEHIEAAEKKSTIIIVADADMLADQFYVQKGRLLGFPVSRVFNDNLNFFSNACEFLTGSDDLINIRCRGKFERPFTTVLELKARAQERWLAKEKELVRQAEATNERLRKLEQQKDRSQRLIVSPEQEKEIAKFREEKRRINRELKQVRKNLRADIENLGIVLKGINMFLMPLAVSIGGIGFAIYRRKRMKRK